MHLIETERLYFREILSTDERGILELDSDPDVHLYLGKNPIRDIDQARSSIAYIREQYATFGIGRLAIVEKATNDFVGWGGFKFITDLVNGHTGYYDLGYRFIKRYQGRGYATESSKAAIEYGFTKLELPVIYAIADVDHVRSRNVLEKCGFDCKEVFYYDSAPHYWFELRNEHKPWLAG